MRRHDGAVRSIARGNEEIAVRAEGAFRTEIETVERMRDALIERAYDHGWRDALAIASRMAREEGHAGLAKRLRATPKPPNGDK